MALAPQYNPPFTVVSPVVSSYALPHGGARFLTDDGHVYEIAAPPGTAPHYGAPAEEPAANWAAGGRHGAKIQGVAAGGFVVWDTAGEMYKFGPQ